MSLLADPIAKVAEDLNPIKNITEKSGQVASDVVNNSLLQAAENIPLLGSVVKDLETVYNKGVSFATDEIGAMQDWLKEKTGIDIDIVKAKEHPESDTSDTMINSNQIVVKNIHGGVDSETLPDRTNNLFKGMRKTLQDRVKIEGDDVIKFNELNDREKQLVIRRVLGSDNLTNTEKHLILNDAKNADWESFLKPTQRGIWEDFLNSSPESTYDILQTRNPAGYYQGSKGIMKQVEEIKPGYEAVSEFKTRQLVENKDYEKAIDSLFENNIITEPEADELYRLYKSGSPDAIARLDKYMDNIEKVIKEEVPPESFETVKPIAKTPEEEHIEELKQGLQDMLEGGRLSEDDYKILVKELEGGNKTAFEKVKDSIKEFFYPTEKMEEIIPNDELDNLTLPVEDMDLSKVESPQESPEPEEPPHQTNTKEWLSENAVPLASGLGISGTTMFALDKLFGKGDIADSINVSDLSPLKDLLSDVNLAKDKYNEIKKDVENLRDAFNTPTTNTVRNNEVKNKYYTAKKEEQKAANELDTKKQQLTREIKQLETKNEGVKSEENKKYLREKQLEKMELAKANNDIAGLKQAVRTEQRINDGVLQSAKYPSIKVNVSPNMINGDSSMISPNQLNHK